MSRNSYWTNNDGLRVGFGSRSRTSQAGVTGTRGAIETARVKYNLADLEDGASLTIASLEAVQGIVIPRGSVLQSSRVSVTTAAAGATAVLQVGLVKNGDVATIDDIDGLATEVVTNLTLGAVLVDDGALVPNGIAGATSDSDVSIVASYTTAAFTAGEVIVEVDFVRPAGTVPA